MKCLEDKTIRILVFLSLMGVTLFFGFYRLGQFPQDVDGEVALYGDTLILLDRAREEGRPSQAVFEEAYRSWVRRLILSNSPQLEIFAFASPLWTVLLHLSYKVLGVSVLATLLPSALVGVSLTLLIYCLGRALYGPAVGFLAGLFLVSSLFFNIGLRAGYGFEQFTPFLSMVVIYLFYRAHKEGRKGYLWLSGFFGGLAWLGSFSSVFLVPFILGGFVLWRSTERRVDSVDRWGGTNYRVRDYLKAALLAFLVSLGLSLLFSRYFQAPPFTSFYWIHKQWIVSKVLGSYSPHQYAPQDLSGLAKNFQVFFRNMFLAMSPEGLTHYGQQFEGKPVINYFVSFFLLIGVIYSLRRRKGADKLCLLWLGINFLVFSLLIAFQPRYMFLALPAVYLIAAQGLVRLGKLFERRQVISYGFLSLVAVLTVLTVYGNYRDFFTDFARRDANMTRYYGQRQFAEYVISRSFPESSLVVMGESVFGSHSNFFFHTQGKPYRVIFWHDLIKSLRLKAREGEIAFEDYYEIWLEAWEKDILREKERIYYVFSSRPFFYYETIGLGRDYWDLVNWEKDIFKELHPGIKPAKEIKFTSGDPALVIYEVEEG